MRCADGSRHTARFAICALPFAVLRRLSLSPAPAASQALAIRTLPYGAITQVELAVKRPFWEEDGLSPNMWTDSPIERVTLNRAPAGEPTTLNLWINGEGALRLDALGPAKARALVVERLARLRPASRGQVEVLAMTAWGADPFARGSYHCWGPGQVRAFGATATAPFSRLRFVGEHASDVMQGMEGALESAERETIALMSQL